MSYYQIAYLNRQIPVDPHSGFSKNHDLNKQSNDLWKEQSAYITYDYNAINSVRMKLSALQIALEKQNELINEQNTLLKKLLNQTYTGKAINRYNESVYGVYYYIEPNL